jgi:hypothetical protein
MKRILVTILAIITASVLHAQITILEGTIGKYPIVMEIRAFDSSLVEVNYFYEKHRKTINLSGKLKREGGISASTMNDESAAKSDVEKFELRSSGDVYTGLWSLDKKRLPVSLKVISINPLKNPYGELDYVKNERKESPFNYVLISGLLFNKDSVSTSNGYTIDWYTEKHLGIPMIQVRNDNNDPTIIILNTDLKEMALKSCIDASSCYNPNGEEEYEMTIQSVYIHEKIFSMNRCVTLYCGGAYPDTGCEGYNLDLTVNGQINIQDILFDSSEDSVFARRIVELFEELYPGRMKKELEESSCDYAETYVWEHPNWYFTDKGLYLAPSFPHVMAVCNYPEWAIIPYAIVNKYKNPACTIQLPK